MLWIGRRILRRICEPFLKNEGYKRRTNREVQLIYQKPDINAYFLNKRLECAGCVWRLNDLLKKSLIGKSKGKALVKGVALDNTGKTEARII